MDQWDDDIYIQTKILGFFFRIGAAMTRSGGVVDG